MNSSKRAAIVCHDKTPAQINKIMELHPNDSEYLHALRIQWEKSRKKQIETTRTQRLISTT